MTLNDPLANVLSAAMNAERRGKKEFTTTSNSGFIRKVLDLLVAADYLASYEVTPDVKGDLLTVRLNGRINKVGVIKPRYQITNEEYERFEKRFLPARGFGLLIISTNQGLMPLDRAKELGIGGALVAYCY